MEAMRSGHAIALSGRPPGACGALLLCQHAAASREPRCRRSRSRATRRKRRRTAWCSTRTHVPVPLRRERRTGTLGGTGSDQTPARRGRGFQRVSPRRAPSATRAPRGPCGVSGGESGIRTRGGLLTHTRFPGVRLKPLIHLSGTANCSGVDRMQKGASRRPHADRPDRLDGGRIAHHRRAAAERRTSGARRADQFSGTFLPSL